MFFVPGGLLLIGMPADLLNAIDVWGIVHKPANATDGIALLSAIFAFGAIIDSLRTVSVQIAVSRIADAIGPKSPNYFKYLDKDSLDTFSLIIDRAFEYLRLNQNILLTLIFLVVGRIFYGSSSCVIIGWLASALVWFIIAIRSQIDVRNILIGFVAGQQKSQNAAEPADTIPAA